MTFHHGSSIVKWILSTSVTMACLVASSFDWSSGLPTLRGRTPLYDLVRAQTLFARQCRFGRPGSGMQMGHNLFSRRCRFRRLGLGMQRCRFGRPGLGMQMGHKLFSQRCRHWRPGRHSRRCRRWRPGLGMQMGHKLFSRQCRCCRPGLGTIVSFVLPSLCGRCMAWDASRIHWSHIVCAHANVCVCVSAQLAWSSSGSPAPGPGRHCHSGKPLNDSLFLLKPTPEA